MSNSPQNPGERLPVNRLDEFLTNRRYRDVLQSFFAHMQKTGQTVSDFLNTWKLVKAEFPLGGNCLITFRAALRFRLSPNAPAPSVVSLINVREKVDTSALTLHLQALSEIDDEEKFLIAIVDKSNSVPGFLHELLALAGTFYGNLPKNNN